MPVKQEPFSALARFLPDHTFERVAAYLKIYPVHLAITRDRLSVQGNYRSPLRGETRHRITVNGGLNAYSFLVTLLHEIAHMYAFAKYKHTIQPHGSEWKQEFKMLLADFLREGIFPEDIAQALIRYINNMKASTCTDPHLYKVLKQYDEDKGDVILVEEVPFERSFVTRDGRVFRKVEKLRTRYKCRCMHSGAVYFVPAVMEVKLV